MKRFISLLFVFLLAACQSLPDLALREPSSYIDVAHTPRLEAALRLPEKVRKPPKAVAANEEPLFDASVYVLDSNRDALNARIMLLDHAASSIDAQYYIWRKDRSGSLLFQKLLRAAERGVRIRLLLDDNNTDGMDDVLAALDAHENIQIRLFNPFLNRRWRAWGYLTDFPRLNRRMHNKALLADNRAAIIGGRNIADEYFDFGTGETFADMDILVGGEIVPRISQEFDRYWNSDSAYPFGSIVKKTDAEGGLRHLQQDFSKTLPYSEDFEAERYASAQVQLVSDDPAKALDRKVKVDITTHLGNALQMPLRELYLVSPYFVPTKTGTALLKTLVGQGVDTTVFTNSLAANDVTPVHSGYARYRKKLLQAGVKLYEFKNGSGRHLDRGLTGSSATSLHAKTFIADKERVFVGSFNLDPRSAKLNTEMGLVIHQPLLAQTIQERLQENADESAYEVQLNEKGRLQWQDNSEGHTYGKEPKTSWFKRLLNRIFSLLPIERLL